MSKPKNDLDDLKRKLEESKNQIADLTKYAAELEREKEQKLNAEGQVLKQKYAEEDPKHHRQTAEGIKLINVPRLWCWVSIGRG